MIAAGAIGSNLRVVGIRLPVSSKAVPKLTSDFTVSTHLLAESGFRWNGDGGALRQQMVEGYVRTNEGASVDLRK
jgi:hypothetical protein